MINSVSSEHAKPLGKYGYSRGGKGLIDAGEEISVPAIPLENQVLYTMYPTLETSWQPTLLFSPFSSF